jgi:hypothetical protein
MGEGFRLSLYAALLSISPPSPPLLAYTIIIIFSAIVFEPEWLDITTGEAFR